MAAAQRPPPGEYAPAFAGYVARISDTEEIGSVLSVQMNEVVRRFGSIAEERSDYRYVPGKWSVKEVIGHLSDTERVFAYRALRIGRADATPLTAFDDQANVAEMRAESRSLSEVAEEWATVRAATVSLFRAFPPAAWTRRGTAGGHRITVRALAYIIVGHTRQHLETLGARYGE